MNTRKNHNGYTLVEIIITIAVAGILAMVAVPNFQGMIQRFRFNGAVQTLSTEVALTRLKAISNNVQYRLSIDQSGDSYTVYEGNLSASSTSWTFKYSNTMPSGVDIYQVESIPSDNITFRPDGTFDETGEATPDGYGRVYIKSEAVDKYKRIYVKAATGKITVELRMGTNWVDERYLVND